MIMLSLVVGILAGLAAMVLKWLIHYISSSLTGFVTVETGNYLYIIYPVIGILLAMWYVRYVVKDNISHGVTRVLYSISQNKSRLKPHNMYTSVVASSITIGFGGSVGAEGPIVFTGAAIGSNLGQAFCLSPRVLMILVGCGAAAGIAGIFKAPIAGMLFTLEVLMLDLTTVTVMPLLIASITAASIAYIFTGYDLEFFFVQSEPFVMERVPFFVALGVFCGLISLYFTRVMNLMENFFRKYLHKQWQRTLVGGTFAPSLYVGCMTGFFFAFLINHLGFGMELSVKNFALMGMAGVMSGVMHAPLMGIFLTAEMTGGYELFLPLLIVSTLSYGTIKIFEPYSIYTMRLARRGELLTHHKDKAVLTLLKMNSVIETDFLTVTPDMNLRQMVDTISKSNRNLFPVINDDNRLIGVVYLDDIRNIMFRPDLYKRLHVSRFMTAASTRLHTTDTMETVMKTFDDTGAWNLPVVDDEGKYVGFVSKSKIFNSYRRVLRHYSED